MENNRMANDKLIEASFKKSTSWLWFVGGKHHHNRVANQGTSNDSEVNDELQSSLERATQIQKDDERAPCLCDDASSQGSKMERQLPHTNAIGWSTKQSTDLLC
jgi:hypothetical protein